MRSENNRPETAGQMACVIVSDEMTTLFGVGDASGAARPAQCVSFTYEPAAGQGGQLALGEPDPHSDGWRLIFFVCGAAIQRLGGGEVLDGVGRRFHLTSDLRGIIAALREPPVSAAAASTYRLGRSIELLCATLRQFEAGALIPASSDGALSPADTRRVMAAKRMIDERWSEKLTLERIARACGLNRAKLTRGFKELFDSTVAEALAARRLGEASQLLLTTNLPVSLVGYEAGYLNNASFARAFGRRFGQSPSSYRAIGLAA